jgi:hypothetical protein
MIDGSRHHTTNLLICLLDPLFLLEEVVAITIMSMAQVEAEENSITDR